MQGLENIDIKYLRKNRSPFFLPFKAFVLRRILALFFPEILNGHILKSRVLTLNHVTKIYCLEIFENFHVTFFYSS